MELGITYSKRGPPNKLSGHCHGIKRLEQLPLNVLQGYSDSDWAGCPDTRRSHSGYVFHLNGGPISWMSKKQDCVAASSTEAEYIALFHAGQESVFIRDILQEMGAEQVGPAELFEDNNSCAISQGTSSCTTRPNTLM